MQIENEFRLSASVEDAFNLLTDIERIAPCMPGAELREVEGEEFRGVIKVKVGPIAAQYKGAARLVAKDALAGRAVLEAEGRETRGQGSARATITATFEPEAGKTLVKLTTDLNITGKVAQMGRGVLGDVSAKLLREFSECLELSHSPADDDRAAEPVAAGSAVGTAAGTAASTAAGAEPEPGPASEVGQPDEHDAIGDPQAADHVVDAAQNGPPPAETAVAPGEADDEPGGAAQAPAAPSGPRKIHSAPAEPVNLVDAAGGSVAKRLAPLAGVVVLIVIVRRIRARRRRAAQP